MEVSKNPLSNLTEKQIKGLMGTIITEPFGYQAPKVSNAAPDTFDSRTQWPSYIHPIRDQQQWGSCWAFGATEALSDRFAINSKGKVDVVLAPEDLVACDTIDQGCNGGYLAMAWRYMQNTGVVTDTCFPYTSGDGSVPHCLHGKCSSTEKYTKY